MFSARFLGLTLFLLPVVAFAQPQNPAGTVAHIINGKSFILVSGDTVRLAGIETPNAQEETAPGHYGRPGEPLGEEAKQALAALVQGKPVYIDEIKQGKRDRHNRILGQAYDAQGRWIQGEMLKSGYAMVYSFNDDPHDLIVRMLGAERMARQAKHGIWAHPYYRIVTPEEAQQFINRFKIVEGRVVSVNVSHENIYINFSEHWKGNFAVFIPRKYADAFAAMKVMSLAGRNVRVRGWIHYHNAPMIDITHPEQIELE